MLFIMGHAILNLEHAYSLHESSQKTGNKQKDVCYISISFCVVNQLNITKLHCDIQVQFDSSTIVNNESYLFWDECRSRVIFEGIRKQEVLTELGASLAGFVDVEISRHSSGVIMYLQPWKKEPENAYLADGDNWAHSYMFWDAQSCCSLWCFITEADHKVHANWCSLEVSLSIYSSGGAISLNTLP